MWKLSRHLVEVAVEALETAPILPVLLDLAPRVREDRTETRLDLDSVTEVLDELIEAPLGDVGPNAQDVRIVGNANRHCMLPSWIEMTATNPVERMD